MEAAFNKNIELLRKAKAGDKSAKNELFEMNTGLVRKIAARFSGRGIEYEDAVQIGSIGLYKAIEKFDFSYDVKFSTYAVPMIIGEIKRFLRDDGPIKVSRSIKENYGKIMNFLEEVRRREETEPTVTEISEKLGIDVEDVVTAITYNPNCESLNATVGTEGGACLGDLIPSNADSEERIAETLSLYSVLEELPERERKLIELRYFKEETQSSVAKRMDISQVQVSRIEKKVLEKLRKKLIFS